jgi:hypothetical protein
VDGGQTLRVSPYHPDQVLQTSEMETALRETQTKFYALDMERVGDDFKVDDGFNIKQLKVKEADADHSLTYIASTFDPYDQVIRDGIYEGGRKIISFCGVLQQDIIPLPRLLQMSMKYGAEAMRRPVEIEFACNINDDRTADFYLLQIRPIVDSKQMLDEDVAAIADDKCLLRSHKSLGHGVVEDVVDVVYVKYDDNFTAANNYRIADDIERINRKFLAEERGYVLVGELLVSTEKITYLACSYADVACWHILVRTYIMIKLLHECLAEAHNFSIATSADREVGTSLGTAHRQCGESILKGLLKAEELHDA